MKAKLSRLDREFDYLQDVTSTISWCRNVWWSGGDGQLTLEDWTLLDSWYRSRALSFSQAGEAMVACIDMANHARGERVSAFFDRDADGNAVLLAPAGTTFVSGQEVTIRSVLVPDSRVRLISK